MVDGIFVIVPQFEVSDKTNNKYGKYDSVPEGFVFRSDLNKKWLSTKELANIIEGTKFE